MGENDKNDPVAAFDSWLAGATEQEVAAAEPIKWADLEEYERGTGHEYVVESGRRLYEYREIVKKRGTRDFTKDVTSLMKRQTAYYRIEAYLKAHGHELLPTEHNEPDRPNPRAHLVQEAIEHARRDRAGLVIVPRRTPVELSENVRVPWPIVRVTRYEVDNFKERREQDPARMYELARQKFYDLSEQPDPQAGKVFWGTLDSDDEVELQDVEWASSDDEDQNKP